MLAGLITAPNHFDPFVRPASAEGRRDVVLGSWREMGTISRGRAAPGPARADRGRAQRDSRTGTRYPYFVDYFKRWFLANPAFGQTYDDRYRLLFTGGLRITTTLDPAVQAAGENAVHQVLNYPGDPDAALTVVDPRTGFVRAMVGGKDTDYWANTRRGAREPRHRRGRLGPADRLGVQGVRARRGARARLLPRLDVRRAGVDHPAAARRRHLARDQRRRSGLRHPQLADRDRGLGEHRLRPADPAARPRHGRADRRARWGCAAARDVGEPTQPLLAVDSAVLGSNEANTLEMASAYGTLATGGKRVAPVPVESVVGPDGSILWQADPKPQQVVDPQVAAAADDILQDVVLYGTGTAANIGRPQIGKTGTDDNHDNAWFVGAVPQLSAAVWVGFHEGQIPMEPPRTRITVFGGTWPAQIWRLLMEKATASLPADAFPTPQVSYVTVAVDHTQDPACLPNEFTPPNHIESQNYVAGTEPTQTCTTPTSLQNVLVPSVIGFDEARATTALTQAGFYLKTVAEASTQPPGTVIYQDPAAGTSKEQTSTVTITVARSPSGG